MAASGRDTRAVRKKFAFFIFASLKQQQVMRNFRLNMFMVRNFAEQGCENLRGDNGDR